jgi:hypothetical protein
MWINTKIQLHEFDVASSRLRALRYTEQTCLGGRMRHLIITAIAVGAIGAPAFSEDIKPTAVSFVEGAVEQSLSGTAGDAANGRIIVGANGQGN